ncbi:P-loop containing nucleoside triphosphate hydrolase protein [Entophlyctis helioformis]|nr:P-loop containing nucleoside triphosphate hydrolase protein [Entophlyctis helioformis]
MPADDIVAIDSCDLNIHVYYDAAQQDSVLVLDDSPSGDPVQAASQHWDLPSAELEGVWDSLVFDQDLPLHLLDFVYTSLLFSDMDVDTNLVSVNRVILLHGPPGTGKTTLCRALAQVHCLLGHKLAIRLSDRYLYGKLVEINAHSLFSKYFAESGKLIMQLFQSMHDLLDSEDVFVCILMGKPHEVESLSATRKSAAAGLEPSDGIRAVNALLTQLDRLRRRKNVLVLTTSNLTDAIDTAFIDRADIKQYIGEPSKRAAYTILTSCLEELMAKHVIQPPVAIQTLRELELFGSNAPYTSRQLYSIACQCAGFSGRTLRKLPFLAHAQFIHVRLDAVAAACTYVVRLLISECGWLNRHGRRRCHDSCLHSKRQ